MATVQRNASKISGLLKMLAEQNYAKNRTLPVLDRDSPEWEAWRGFYNRYGLFQSGFMETQERWTVPCLHPPMNETELREMIDIGHSAKKRRVG